jgi:RNA polymerase sigma-70 factor, ECF subfamily
VVNSKHRGTETWNEALDENAFRALYEEHFNYVWFTLRRHGVRARDLEDLTHDVFVACARAWDRYDTDRPLRPWLHGIAFRVASDHRRRGQVANEVPVGEVLATVDGPTAIDAVEASERRSLILDCLTVLSDDQRHVFVRHELEGESVVDIARALNIAENTAYSRLRLARRRFTEAVRRRASRGV